MGTTPERWDQCPGQEQQQHQQDNSRRQQASGIPEPVRSANNDPTSSYQHRPLSRTRSHVVPSEDGEPAIALAEHQGGGFYGRGVPPPPPYTAWGGHLHLLRDTTTRGTVRRRRRRPPRGREAGTTSISPWSRTTPSAGTTARLPVLRRLTPAEAVAAKRRRSTPRPWISPREEGAAAEVTIPTKTILPSSHRPYITGRSTPPPLPIPREGGVTTPPNPCRGRRPTRPIILRRPPSTIRTSPTTTRRSPLPCTPPRPTIRSPRLLATRLSRTVAAASARRRRRPPHRGRRGTSTTSSARAGDPSTPSRSSSVRSSRGGTTRSSRST